MTTFKTKPPETRDDAKAYLQALAAHDYNVSAFSTATGIIRTGVYYHLRLCGQLLGRKVDINALRIEKTGIVPKSQRPPRPPKVTPGQEFDHLTAEEYHPPGTKVRGNSAWTCLCKCGVRKVVAQVDLLRGNSRSCGCRRGKRKIEPQKTENRGQ